MFKKSGHTWIIGVLVLMYIMVQAYCIPRLSINYDEGLFAYYGTTILKLQGNKDVVKFDSKLPVTALNMLPRAFVQLLHPGLKRPNSDIDIIMGRYVSLLVTIILALLICYWSSLLYGDKAGLFSLVIFLLCPNFLAHGIFVSSDIYACLFMTSSFYFLWQFSKSGQTKTFFFVSLSVAFAQVAKFSMVHLFILIPLLLAIKYFSGARNLPVQKINKRRILELILIFAFTNWFIICAAHLFYGMFIPLNNYQFRSTAFQHLQLLLQGMGNWLPVPLPSSYIESLDIVIYLDHLGGGRAGSTLGPLYMLGKSSADGFWYYYFVALFYKLPLSVLAVLGFAVTMFFSTSKRRSFLQNEMYLIVPAGYFLVYLNFFYSTQIGIRHILIIMPLMYVFAGFFFQQVSAKKYRYAVYGLLVYQLISVGLYFPHFLPYTNELIGDKKMAYKKIADTNICYGEGEKYLLEYLKAHPEAKYLPETIRSGKIIMEVNAMLNINIATMGKYDWVRPLQPSGHIHSQYLIFDISPAVADSLRKLHL